MLIRWENTIAWDLDAAHSLGVLSVGSTEQHGDYLPLGTDSIAGERLVAEAAEKAAGRILMLPSQHIGFSPHHKAFPGVLTLRNDVMVDYLTEVCESAFCAGLPRLLIVNSHGGNQTALQAVVNRLGAECGRKVVLVRYWDLIADQIDGIRRSAPGGMGHAGEFEASLMLHYAPELTDPSRMTVCPPAQGDVWHNPDMFAKNRIYRYIPFDTYSKLGTIGQAYLASKEEGETLARLITDKLAELMNFEYSFLPHAMAVK
jgi:creatinine amidohydrolase